ncbi:hypothetical protein [Mangrovimonas xylaniphaga]|uniref:hypothetical protein n=1 Tax=Mangrovimonas xylaniphaga TaxID=1645915 RepID=UPI0006B4221E|nr:hypothetical protein [Mangrovimonas xylaniphaga]
MLKDIFIKSNLFPPYPNEEDEINPGRFGKKLAEFIKQNLEQNNIQVADIYPTDYAYEMRLDQYKFSVYLITGNIDEETDQFIVTIKPNKEFIRKLFKKISTKETLEPIYSTILNSFEMHPDIQILKE